MVALLQPSKRLGKRNIMAIDEFQPKRARVDGENELSLASIQHHNVGEILDHLMRDYGVTSTMRNQPLQGQVSNRRNTNAPIISDVTDELDNLNTTVPQPSTDFQQFDQYPQQSSQQFPFNQVSQILFFK